jgi:hypothetical protein
VKKHLLVIGLFAIATLTGSAHGAPKDPAARGLDLFILAPAEAPSGSMLPVQVRAYGFATVATPAPLGGATVEATWDPESLGGHPSNGTAAVRPGQCEPAGPRGLRELLGGRRSRGDTHGRGGGFDLLTNLPT